MKVVFTREAEHDLRRLGREVASRIVSKIIWQAEHFAEQIPQPLGAGFRGFFKLRVGDWRVVYEIEHTAGLLVVHLIDHRSRIYERRP
mgnify:CR=1 FL=1